jgi:4-amino-4-deoxy-L-arabinose transferase-like glycosyltransferase
MAQSRRPDILRNALLGEIGILVLLALAKLILHLAVNGQYGFHRDELATLDDARYLAWGYVAYPPVTPFVARIALELFGPSLVGVRFFAALTQALSLLLVGLMARELGGTRRAQILAVLAVVISPVSLVAGSMFMYVSFDYLWWLLVAYLVIRLLKTNDPRYWLGIGATIGLGMMTKYTMGFLVAGIVLGVLLTKERRHLTSRWLWGGVALSLLIFLPNLIWQLQHGFVTLEFLGSIHERDVRIGRTSGYLLDQLYVTANPLTIPLWAAGLCYYLFMPAGRGYRVLGWMFVIPFLLFLVAQGRSYYVAAAYPMLIAAGAVLWDRWLRRLSDGPAKLAGGLTWASLAVGGALMGSVMLPIAPINSALWNVSIKVHDSFVEQVGWPDLVETVAGVYHSLPAEERAQSTIVAGNYGEAGAISLYGPAYGLPTAISGVNSYWLRGYGEPNPRALVVVGFSREYAGRYFEECAVVAKNSNRFGVLNEETRDHPDIFVCRKLRQPWPALWNLFRYFG